MKRSILFFLVLWTVLPGCVSSSGVLSLAPLDEHLALKRDEKRLWERAQSEEKAVNESGLIYQDPELERYLNRVAQRLLPSGIPSRFPVRVKVVKAVQLNAFSLPNGALYLHSGILARMDNEAQLAALLAHEEAHFTHRHALRFLRTVEESKEPENLPTSSAYGEGERGHPQEVMDVLGSIGWMAAVTGYSRELETEADVEGLKAMVRAGYDPREAIRLFEHLRDELKREKQDEPFFFGTHPGLQDRIKNCRLYVKKTANRKGKGHNHAREFLHYTKGLILENAFLDLKAGRFESTVAGARKYLSLNPDDPRAYFLMGEVFRQRENKGDRKKAIAFYKKAISKDPSYPDPHKALGLIYYKRGEKKLARRSFELTLSLAPFTPDKEYIQGYIRKCNP